MGIIKDRVDEIFENFENHNSYMELIRDLLSQNYYAWGWQRDEFNNAVHQKLDAIEKKKK